jgi:hypothetical protein
MLELGRRMESRTAGLVELPAFEETQLAIARHGDLFGVLILEGGESPVIRLWPDRVLSIRVVDPSGRPVPGVPVALRSGTGRDWSSVYWEKLTDDQGLAVMRHIGIEWYGFLEPGALYYAALSFPLADPVEVLLESESFPSEPVEPVLPATGSVSLELVDSNGAPCSVRTWAYLQPLTKSRTDPERAECGPRFGAWLDHESRARFPHVGLGLDLQASTDGTGIVKPASGFGKGPTKAGENVEIDLTVDATHAFFSGRLVDVAGQPVALYVPMARVTYRNERGEGKSPVAIDFGSKGPVHVPSTTRLGVCRTLSFRPPRRSRTGPAAARSPAPAPGRGRVRRHAAAAPLSPCGRVLDELESGCGVWMDTGRKHLIQPPNEEFAWGFGVNLPGVYTDQSGVFEMWGEVDAGEYALWGKKTGYTSLEWTPFEIGAQNVEIVIARESIIAGTVLADGGFALERLSIVIEDPSHDPVREWFVDSRSQVQPSGAFRVEGLRPGKVRLLVHSGRYSGALWVLNDVELVAGECVDPRVQTIDLRGRLHAREIEVVDDAGNPVPTGCVIVRPGDPGEESRVYVIDEGRAAWIGAGPAVDVQVRAPGFRDASVLGVSGSRKLSLERGIPVVLALPAGVERPPSPWELAVGLHPPGNRPDQSRKEYTRDSARELYWSAKRVDSHARFGSDSQATLYVPFEGRFELDFELVDAGDSMRGARSKSGVRHGLGGHRTLGDSHRSPSRSRPDYERVLGTVR